MTSEESKRAERRQKKRNMIEHAKEVLRRAWGISDSKLPLLAVKHADNLKSCSCYMCGNPRKYSKGKEKHKVNERKKMIEDKED